MEGSEASLPGQAAPAGRGGRWADWHLLLVLILLAGGIRAWVICRTEVISRDSIVFIDYAHQLESKPWKEVLTKNHQHPGYPLSLLAVSLPVRALLGRTDCFTMQLSGQLATAMAGVLLVIPMFYLGKELFDRGAGFWAALLFQCLPVSGRLLSDALSEGLFLLLVTTALLAAARALRTGSWRGWAGCGVCAGLAYLTRPEGLGVVAAGVLLLLLMQGVPSWRRGWRWTLSRGAALVVPALVVGAPYAYVIGQLSIKPSTHQTILELNDSPLGPAEVRAPANPPVALAAAPGGDVFLPPGVWLNTKLALARRLGHGLWGVASELLKGFHYTAWLPALLGLAWHGDRLRRRPAFWLVGILCLLHGLVLWRLAMAAGYVSERHVLLLVLCGLYPAVVGLRELPARLAAWRRSPIRLSSPGAVAAWSLALLLLVAGSGLPKTMLRLHANRKGHREAGLWLAKHARPGDEVMDGHFGWARYYAGRLFVEDPSRPAKHPTRYVVKGSSRERHNPYGPTASQADMTVEQIRAAGGKVVYHWPEQRPEGRADVVIWAVPLPAPPALSPPSSGKS